MKIKHFLFKPWRLPVILIAAVGSMLYLTSELGATPDLESKETPRRFYIGQTPLSKAAPKQNAYSIEYELYQSDNSEDYQLKDRGAFCYGKNDPCFQWVGQTLNGTPNAQTGLIPVWEYGVQFFPPNAKGMTGTVYTNLAALKNPADNKLSLVVPNFLQGGGFTALGSWNEAIFQVSAVQRLKIRARLVRGVLATPPPVPSPFPRTTPTIPATPLPIGTPVAR